MALKYSRQREVIKDFLCTRKDHPTADVVYMNVRQEYPNISLGTVYRNLTLLSEIGEIRRLRVGDGVDHFDADTSPHHHFICSHCGRIIDLKMENIDYIRKLPKRILMDASTVIPPTFSVYVRTAAIYCSHNKV